jgi:hypothetical protein
MVECAVCLFAAIPAALVHSLDLFISATRALVLLGAWDGYEGIDLLSGS